MASLTRLNRVPGEAECIALHEVIAREEAVLDTIWKVQREHEAEHQLLAAKAIMLRRNLDSTETLREVGSQLCTHFMPLLAQLETQLAVQEDDKSHLPSTLDFIHSWGVIKGGIIALDASLKRQLRRTQERITSVTEQLYGTESLRDQVSSTISSFSSMIEHAQESIKAKKRGILHPIRRLPVEILLQIFEDCVNDEIDDHHRNPPRLFRVPPTMALRLASVCSRWRDIMLETPYLWRHLRMPEIWGDIPKRGSPGARNHLQNYLDRCRGGEIELTIRAGGKPPADLIPNTTTIRRLNLSANNEGWPNFNLPSPVHLWLYRTEPARGWVVSSDLISRTTHLTVWNVEISFQGDCKSLIRLEVCGVQPAFVFTKMISQSPHLTEFDLTRAEMEAAILGPVSFTHFHLRYLGLSHGWIELLERALNSGLHLSQLRHLELSNITSEYMATKYPLISAQLGARVVRLDFQGGDCAIDATRSFIDAFRRVNTIGFYGRVTETVLGALYEVRTSRVQIPGQDTIRCTREVVHAMPKGLEVVIIRDYEGDGRKIDQRLRMMRQNPAPDTQPVNIIFENCLNILPHIRREFAVPEPPPIDIESPDPHLGQSSCDPGDVNDRNLDRLEAADGLSG